MHAIEIGGDRYIKATDAAKLTGYATDYIGQLSRGKKISAERVGRAWYVCEREILAHKKGKKRSNKRKTQEALKHHITENGQIHHAYFDPKQESVMPEYRKRLLATEVRYEGDTSPLTPSPSKESRPDEIYPIETDKKDTDIESEASNEEEDTGDSIETENDTDEASVVEDSEEEEVTLEAIREPQVSEPLESPVRVSVVQKHISAKPKKISHIPIKETHVVPHGSPSYALMVPVAKYVVSLALAFALIASIGGIFVEKVMVYEQGESEAPYYETSYGMRAVSAVIQSLPR